MSQQPDWTPVAEKNMWNLIKRLASNGVTIFLTTQYLEEADQLAHKIAVISGGKIVEEGTAEELKRIVGQERLELTFSELTSLYKAQNLLEGQLNENDRLISVTTAGSPEDLRQLLNTLHEYELEPASVKFCKPTLDDVFMEITRDDMKGAAVND